MIVTYQDELGLIEVMVDEKYGVGFDGTEAYFTDEDGVDYRIDVKHIVGIHKAE